MQRHFLKPADRFAKLAHLEIISLTITPSCGQHAKGLRSRKIKLSIDHLPLPGFPENKIYTLSNDNGITIALINYGATIKSIMTPDRNDDIAEITLSLPQASDYIQSPLFAGATLGPTAGRIQGGILPIKDMIFHLDRNDGKNTLHGGSHNLSHVLWDEKATHENPESSSVCFTTTVPDGIDGFPGERTFEVKYTLENDSLSIEYSASSSKTTWVNLSNHSYFNLSGNLETSALDHRLQIKARHVLLNNGEHLPVSLSPVRDTPFDFSKAVTIMVNIDSYPANNQIRNCNGYNNAYDLSGCRNEAVNLFDPSSGRTLKIYTDYPAVVFYSGGYLGRETALAGGKFASPGCALAFEPQQFPDAVNLRLPGIPAAEFLEPGKTQRNFIRYQFGTA